MLTNCHDRIDGFPPPPALPCTARSLWHDLKPATDGVRVGTLLSNGRRIPAPAGKTLAQTATAEEVGEERTDNVCTLDVRGRDPYK